jgi:hypothetical protein
MNRVVHQEQVFGRLPSPRQKCAIYSIIPQNLRDGFVREGMNRVVRAGIGVRAVALTRTKVRYI